VDFTREPLVETVITPKEGFKLIIRASSGNLDEEYSVGAVEVVSFGNCYFFRSLEKPKTFLLPMTKYEVVETRETRTVLKKPQIEKNIKIGGGKKVDKEDKEELGKEEPKKREKKRSRKRRSINDEKVKEETPKESTEAIAEGNKDEKKEEFVAPRRTLLPPPTSLISDQIDRYKNYLVEQGALLPEELEEAEKKVEDIPQTDENTPPSEEIPPEEKVVDINEEAHVPSEDEES
jgi:hypothetical protein